MSDARAIVDWLRNTLDAEADLAQRVAARHTASHDVHVPEERRGKPFWPLAGARRRYEEFAPGEKWSDPDLYAGLTLIEAYSPQRVLRRIAADRKLIAEYEKARAEYDADGKTWDYESNVGRARTAALEEAVRLLAEGWGWTEEEQR